MRADDRDWEFDFTSFNTWEPRARAGAVSSSATDDVASVASHGVRRAYFCPVQPTQLVWHW